MLPDFLTHHWLTLHSLTVSLGLVVYVISSHARRQRRHPSAAIAWVVSLLFMPYLALPLYLLIGSRELRNTQPLPSYSTNGSGGAAPGTHFQHLAAAMGLPPPATYEALNVHDNGAAARDALMSLIQDAKHSLDLCTFLLGRDCLGREISDLLIRRAKDGVRVRLLVDGIGVYLGGHPDLKPMALAGVKVALFVSPFSSALPGRTNLRNHRKMAIADGQRVWTGGRNLAAEYFVGDPLTDGKESPWLDLSFDFRGDLARQTQERFDQDWCFATQTAPSHPPSPAVMVTASDLATAQLVPSGPDQADDTLYSLLVSSCFSAKTRIVAVTPYFLPDATLLMALTLAARRGVVVDLVLPRRSNHRLADLARPSALRDMVNAGARVWLLPQMIHAKSIIVDDQLALVGSANLDDRSMFLNYELMFAFSKPIDVNRFAQWTECQRQSAVLYRPPRPSVLRELLEGWVRWVAFQL